MIAALALRVLLAGAPSPELEVLGFSEGGASFGYRVTFPGVDGKIAATELHLV